jgi:putative glycosyltransferase (TIGR04372 family)
VISDWPRKAASFALRPLWLLLGALLYLVALALSPWRTLRVGALKHDRIGHLALNTELFLRARAAEQTAPRDWLLFFSGAPANRQLFEMIRRRLPVHCHPLFRVFYDRGVRPFFKGSRFAANIDRHSNEFTLSHLPPQLSFTPEEEEQGRRLLESMGVPPGQSFACFYTRDKTYLDRMHTHKSRTEWSYHDYRDCAIANCLPAARMLTGRGLYMLRMGHSVERALQTEDTRIIDYAARHRSDFGDIYLTARCKFFLGNTGGLTCVPMCFNVPVIFTNLVPIGYLPIREGDLLIPKKYWDQRENRLLSVREIFSRNLGTALRTEKFNVAGVQLIENSAEEITAVTAEMDARLDGRWVESPEDEQLQKRFWAAYPPDHPGRHCPARVGAAFLRENPGLLV